VAATHAVITNLDDDHCWSVGGLQALQQIFSDFAGRADQVFSGTNEVLQGLLASHPKVAFLPTDAGASLPLIGAHNRSNGAMAVAVTATLGVTPQAATAALAEFSGVDRRLSLRLEGPITIVEDYAHHPTELQATLDAVREEWPNKRIYLVFQPHRNERVARYGADFATALATADQVIVTRPFDAWINDADLADPRQLLAHLGDRGRYTEADWKTIAQEVTNSAKPNDLILIAGAGTLSRLPPLLCKALS
jgi:UDP-N-acetylmuramate--alanine ligase